MKLSDGSSVVKTIKEKCRVCFTCVRECPAKAIRIIDGQADVIGERCIGCGNCVRVCSQKAKSVQSSIKAVKKVLSGKLPKIALLAPSFPAEFHDVDYKIVVGALKMLGFDFVYEVGFGADLVAKEYKKLVDNNKGKSFIATTCPAIVAYVEKYHPDLVDYLAPIVSPMIASSRVVKSIHGKDVKIVFIGPCVAKKVEKDKQGHKGEIDEVLTFVELRELFGLEGINRANAKPSEFDGPPASSGALFAISRGMLHAANIKEDLVEGNVVVADGRNNFVEAIKEFEKESLMTNLLETLCCEGCVMGAGINSKLPLYKRRSKVSSYVNDKLKKINRKDWEANIEKFKELDLKCEFQVHDQRIPIPSEDKINDVLKRMGKYTEQDELNCGACGYENCRDHAMAILKGLAENEMCLPYTIEKLKDTVSDLEKSYGEMKSVKEALTHRDKLASMGQLAAGIAHEINNPLGVVLMYAHILLEQCGKDNCDMGQDVKIIVEQADRCKKIVSGLLNFARQNRVVRTPVNVVDLVNRCLDVISTPSNITMELVNKLVPPTAELDRDQFSQVLTNLINNSIDAMTDTTKQNKLTIVIDGDDNNLKVIVEDTGTGIPEKYINRIFDPFFTTKEIGKGTGLGLPVSYGIIKMHSGDIRVESNNDLEKGSTGTKITISMPRHELKNGFKI